nr:50S ribosomal protein L10 [Mesomycoplasma ovipneumoniae]
MYFQSIAPKTERSLDLNAFRQKKAEIITEIRDLLEKSSSLAIAEYRGLSVAELESLRQELKKSGVFTRIYKNRLFKIAADELGFSNLKSELVGPNLFAFGLQDPIAPAKIITKVAKDQPLLILKGGIYEKSVVTPQENTAIASLPNYTEAITMLASSLQAPLKQLAFGLKLLIDEQKITA